MTLIKSVSAPRGFLLGPGLFFWFLLRPTVYDRELESVEGVRDIFSGFYNLLK